MPIKIPDTLPAARILETEGVSLIPESAAIRQDIRPLRIAVLNLMPEKIKTETQLARLLAHSPLQVELTLVMTGTYRPKTTPREHLIAFYQTWEAIADQRFDGLIVTGAPVETLPFEDVLYWRELIDIFEWTKTNVYRTLDICWGAQAAAYHFHGLPKYTLPAKRFGVFSHTVLVPEDSLLRGFDDAFYIPVSRHTEVRAEDVAARSGLEMLAWSDEAGVCLLKDRKVRHHYMFNHVEYDDVTLADEYYRDIEGNRPITLPANYFPGDDPARPPRNRWRSHAHLLFGNWLNDIYQGTPFDLADLAPDTV